MAAPVNPRVHTFTSRQSTRVGTQYVYHTDERVFPLFGAVCVCVCVSECVSE